MVGIPEITPREVKKLMDDRQPFVLIDVREPHEFHICRIPGSTLIPLGEVPKRMHELDSAQEIVVHCRSGQRSARAVDLLMKAGFRKIHNMKGGILAWSDQVDPSVPKY
jgi:adenylyltransferase/sulfurtransferase